MVSATTASDTAAAHTNNPIMTGAPNSILIPHPRLIRRIAKLADGAARHTPTSRVALLQLVVHYGVAVLAMHDRVNACLVVRILQAETYRLLNQEPEHERDHE